MLNLVVYSCITGDYERPKPLPVPLPHIAQAEGLPWRNTNYVLFTDHNTSPRGWDVRPLAYSHPDPRRAARWHKVMGPSVLFPDADYTIWHDGSHVLTANPWDLVDRYLRRDDAGKAADFASFRHPQRSCVYDEIRACIALKKDDPKMLHRVANYYSTAGMSHCAGLFETACVVRRDNAVTYRLNELWWKEIELGSVRDQVSLPYALWKLQQENLVLNTTHIEGCRDRSPYFDYTPHRNRR